MLTVPSLSNVPITATLLLLLNFPERHICVKTFDARMQLFTHAAAPSSRTRNPRLRGPPPQQVTMNRCGEAVYLYLTLTLWPTSVPHPPGPICSSTPPHPIPSHPRPLHLPLSISEPPGRPVRDGSAPTVPSRPAAARLGHLDP